MLLVRELGLVGGELVAIEARIGSTWDGAALDGLIMELMEQDQALAARVNACRKESTRSGYLKFNRPKAAKRKE